MRSEYIYNIYIVCINKFEFDSYLVTFSFDVRLKEF